MLEFAIAGALRAPLADEAAVVVEDLNLRSTIVRDIDIAGRVNRDADRTLELTVIESFVSSVVQR